MVTRSETHLLHLDETINRGLCHAIQHLHHLVLQELWMTSATKAHEKLLGPFSILFHLQYAFHTVSETLVK